MLASAFLVRSGHHSDSRGSCFGKPLARALRCRPVELARLVANHLVNRPKRKPFVNCSSMITAVGSKEDTLAGRVRGVMVTRQGSERRVEHGMAYRSVTSVARDDALELVRSRLGWTVVAMDAQRLSQRRHHGSSSSRPLGRPISVVSPISDVPRGAVPARPVVSADTKAPQGIRSRCSPTHASDTMLASSVPELAFPEASHFGLVLQRHRRASQNFFQFCVQRLVELYLTRP